MKCDVCGTRIMPGEKECPNCGYKWKDSHVNTFDVTSQSHEHIQVKKSQQSLNKKDRYPGWFYVIFIIAVMGIIGSIAVPALISRYHIEDYQKYTFQELMNKGYGDSNVLFKVINEKDEAFNYFKYDLQLVEANVQENSYLDGKDVNGLSFEVSGYKDDTYFGMRYEYDQDGEIVSKELFFINRTNESIRETLDFQVDNSVVHSLANYIGVGDIDENLKRACQNLEKGDQEIYETSQFVGGIKIYLSEQAESEESAAYRTYCSVEIVK